MAKEYAQCKLRKFDKDGRHHEMTTWIIGTHAVVGKRITVEDYEGVWTVTNVYDWGDAVTESAKHRDFEKKLEGKLKRPKKEKKA